MTKVIFVTFLISFSIYLTCAYQQDCAIGPAFWCKSFQNAADCGAVRHCTDTIWRYDNKRSKIDSSTKCEWCESILENAHKAIQIVAHDEELIKMTLFNGCKMLPLEDISSKCDNVIENYYTTVMELMRYQRYDKLCRLMDICQNNELVPNIGKPYVDTQSKILCNVIVRATHELHNNQQKTRSEIQTYLKNDCQLLDDFQLVQKCKDLVERHGNEIYAHVVSRVESSKICDYMDDFSVQSVPQVGCDLCTFVFSIAKQMLDMNHTEEKALMAIDENICSHLTGVLKKNCKNMIDTNGRDLLDNLRKGVNPMLICTHFMYCFDNITTEISPIKKDEMHSFLMDNVCDKVGSLKSACEALLKIDGTHLLKVLLNEINGRELCKMFGLCRNISFLTDELDPQDDPSQCKRCVADFTRRKHIAEKLVNHSSEFLHHLCEQLPQKDECTKAVDDSINELVTYIRSLDPRSICVELKMCDETSLENIQATPSDDAIEEEIIEYIKTDVCTKLGSLNLFCNRLVDTEGLNLLKLVGKTIDSNEVCSIVDVCPSNSVMKVCTDKCQCCVNRIEIYQGKLAQLMEALVGSTRILCDEVPSRDTCLELVDQLEIGTQKLITHFNSKPICQSLSFCSDADIKTNPNQCDICKHEVDERKRHFKIITNEMKAEFLSFCSHEECRANVIDTHRETYKNIDNIGQQDLCQRLGYCIAENMSEPSSTLLRLRSLAHYQTKTFDERVRSIDICSQFGQLKSMCEHVLKSPQYNNYGYLYVAVLRNDPSLINEALRIQMSTEINVDLCDSCKNTVQSSKDFFSNAIDTVLDTLIHACQRCPFKDQCRDLITKRVDAIKSFIDNINSDEFCNSLGLCKTSSLCTNMGMFQQACEEILARFTQSFQNDRETLEKHLPHTSVVVLPTKKVVVEEEKETDLLKDSNSTCILCEYLMKILTNYIHQNSTEQEIEQSFEKICNQMPQTLQKQCHELVDDYGPPVIAILLREFDLNTVCRKLNLCTDKMKVQVSYLTRANEATCGICDYVSTYINFALKRDSSDKSLQHALSTVCQHLSNEQHSQCQTLVQLVGPHARKLGLDLNRNFCQQLTICQMPMSELQPAMKLNHISLKEKQFKEAIIKNLDDTPECMLCHYAVSYLDAVLKNNKSEAAVEAALEKVCTILPRKERARCDAFVKTYGAVIAELIADTADPDAICRYIGMCQVVLQETTTTTIE